ncbi:MAG TPA: beta-aspartyl-peptidase [Gemmatimonadales bacterium]|nr:beta-aspartyl-peptidase [Gemmatimonadales bacterium]
MLMLLSNAEVYAPEPRDVRHVLIGGGKILWLGRERPAFPAGLGVIERDFAGLRLIPGFVDCHVHLTGGGGESGPETRVPPVPLTRFTTGGTTTVVGVLGTDDVTRTTGDLVAAARGLTAEGITAYCHTGGYHVPPVTLTGTVRGDIVHIDRILGVGEVALSDHRSSQPTLDELLRLASEAHVAGLMTGKGGIAHLHLGDGPRGLDLVRQALEASEIPPRVFNPTHVNRRKALFEEALSLADRGVTIDVTAFPVAPGEDAWSAEDALLQFLDAGLPANRITVSSDGGGCLPKFDADGRVTEMEVGSPGALAGTLRVLLDRGEPLERALPAFTSNPADLLRLPDKGRIEVGADADLVVLDPNGEITDVMAMGRWHLMESRPTIRGAFEERLA